MIGPDEYDQLLSRNFKDYSMRHQQLYKIIVELLKDKPALILEVGCGIGYGLELLYKNNCFNFYEGFEVSKKCCDYIEETLYYIKRKRINNIEFNEDYVDVLGIKMFDFSLCIEVIEHMENVNLVNFFKKMLSFTKVASFISTPDINTDKHGLYTKEEVQDALYKAGYNHVIKIEWQIPHTLFIAEV